MSLNLTIANCRYVLQVSDRRLCRIAPNRPPQFYTDRASKAIVVVCKDAFFSISYHGVGEAHGLRTNRWLLDRMAGVQLPLKTVAELAELIAKWCTEWYRTFPVHDQSSPHTFVMAGYWHLHIPFVLFVSNFEHSRKDTNPNGASCVFEGSYIRPKPDSTNFVCVYAGGQHQSIVREDRDLLNRLAQAPGAKPADVTSVAVRAIQKAARGNTTVSPSCISVLFTPANPNASCNYWSVNARTLHLPDYAGPFFMFGGEVAFGPGPPPWRIMDAIPTGASAQALLDALLQLSDDYKTGEDHSEVTNSYGRRFLETLPKGVPIEQIRSALSDI